MPHWIIFHPIGTFEEVASKSDLAQSITGIYTRFGLPAFYVVITFIKLPLEDIWIGGEHSRKPFIRITVDHIALTTGQEIPNNVHGRITSLIDDALKAHIGDKGYEWEFHVDETDRRLWKVNGLVPPPYKSKVEAMWAKENKAVPYDTGKHYARNPSRKGS
jgi:hypothetical protein